MQNGTTNIVKEPDKADNEKPPPVVLDDQSVRDSDVLHRLALELLRLFELESKQEQKQRRNDTKTQGETPAETKVTLCCNQNHHVGHESANDKAPVNRNVCEHNEPE